MMKFLLTTVFVFLCALGFSRDVRAASISKPVSNLGLVGYWSFDEGTSTVAHDFSGNGNNGTLTNMDSTTDWVVGKRGKALDFDGTDAYVNIPWTTNLASGTISIWMRSNSAFAGTKVFIEGDGTDVASSPSFEGDATTLRFYVGNGCLRTAVYTQGEWTHFVGTWDGVNSLLYKNGVLVSSGGCGNTESGFTKFTLGSRSGGLSADVTIDEARIHNRALSSTEIVNLYRQGQIVKKTVSNNGLVGHWSFNEGTSTIAHDFSGNGNNGTLQDTPSWVNGKREKATNLNGTSQYVIVPDSESLDVVTAMSMGGWVKMGAVASNYPTIICKPDSDDWAANPDYADYCLRVFTDAPNIGKFEFFLNDYANTRTYSSTIVARDTWYHVFATYDNSQIKIYVNGVLETTSSVGSGKSRASTIRLGIGARAPASAVSEYWNGQLDDIRLYNRTLSPQEIDELYRMNETKINASQDTKMTNGLIGMWSFNGKDMNWAANLAYDRSGIDNNGSITNMSTTTSPVPGKVGQALVFDGVDDRIARTTTSYQRTNGQELSVSVWIKPERLSGQYQGIVAARNSGVAHHWHLYQHTTDGSIQLHGSVQNKSTYIPALDKWTHILATVDAAGAYKLYANGVEVQSVSGFTYNTTTTNTLFIGTTDVGVEMYKGGIDEARVYNRALTSAEAKQLYLLGK